LGEDEMINNEIIKRILEMIKKIWANKYGRIGVSILAILTFYHIFFGNHTGVSVLTPDDIAPKIKDISNGKIELQDVKVEKMPHITIYSARWNDYIIMGKVSKNNHMENISVITKLTVDQMDEITIGQYLELAKDVMGIVNPNLSNSKKDHILQYDLGLNDVMENGLDHTVTVDGQKYTLMGGNGGSLFFTIQDAKK
jgi:hypothetical protein